MWYLAFLLVLHYGNPIRNFSICRYLYYILQGNFCVNTNFNDYTITSLRFFKRVSKERNKKKNVVTSNYDSLYCICNLGVYKFLTWYNHVIINSVNLWNAKEKFIFCDYWQNADWRRNRYNIGVFNSTFWCSFYCYMLHHCVISRHCSRIIKIAVHSVEKQNGIGNVIKIQFPRVKHNSVFWMKKTAVKAAFIKVGNSRDKPRT